MSDTGAHDADELSDPLADFLAVYDRGGREQALIKPLEVPSDGTRRYLSFELAGEVYAADIMDVREILKLFTLTEVPRTPREVLGVLSKRGVVMPVLDLAAVLGLRAPSRDITRDQRVLVAGDGDRTCGLRVDRVHTVMRLSQRQIEEVPASLGARQAHMLIGLGRPETDAGHAPRMLILLDVTAVLDQFASAMGVQPGRPGGQP